MKAFTSSFCNYRTMDAHAYGEVPPFLQEKVLKNDAKNNLICERKRKLWIRLEYDPQNAQTVNQMVPKL